MLFTTICKFLHFEFITKSDKKIYLILLLIYFDQLIVNLCNKIVYYTQIVSKVAKN